MEVTSYSVLQDLSTFKQLIFKPRPVGDFDEGRGFLLYQELLSVHVSCSFNKWSK